MAKAKKTVVETKPGPSELRVTGEEGKSREKTMAEIAASPIFRNAFIGKTFSAGTFGSQDGITEAAEVLAETVGKVRGGDLAFAEDTLAAQASALDSIFVECARRAANNLGHYPETVERYMRLALKAQSQCRATLETLATIKNPPIIYARQANIANGPQQVNNGAPAAPPHAQAGKSENQQTELLEAGNGADERLDRGAAGTAIGGDPALEAVGAIDRPAHR